MAEIGFGGECLALSVVSGDYHCQPIVGREPAARPQTLRHVHDPATQGRPDRGARLIAGRSGQFRARRSQLFFQHLPLLQEGGMGALAFELPTQDVGGA